jgi:pyridoxal phosphate enzyme (YggS family)
MVRIFQPLKLGGSMGSIADNLARVKERMAEAAIRSGRTSGSVKLVGVTKTVDLDRIKEAVSAGLQILGENYVQEARDKIRELKDRVSWHFVGRLQTNKAKYAVKLFDMIQTVDTFRLAQELNRRAQPLGRTVPILIQVNLASEVSKGGVEPSECLSLIRQVSVLENLQIRGLMTMPPFFDQPERARPYFAQLREMSQEIAEAQVAGVEMNELSMGMSGDFEAAIKEGATLIRVGTAIFGERP